MLMDTPSGPTYEFHRKKLNGDGLSLYASFRYLTNLTIDNKRLQSVVADYISKNTDLHCVALESGTKCKTIKDYCDQVKKGNVRDGVPVLRALAMVGHIIIHLVSMITTAQGSVNITIENFGEHVETFKECIYIFCNEENKYYEPLYLINKQNSDDKVMIFRRGHETISEYMGKFIKEVLHYDDFVQIDCCNPSNEKELPTTANAVHENEQMFNLVAPEAITKSPVTQKMPNYEKLYLAQTIEQVSPSSTSILNKSTKSAEVDIYQISTSDKNNSESITIEQHLQMDMLSANESGMHNVQEDRMRFEIEPTLKFRGRTRGNFKPKKSLKRNGQTSEPSSPRYFADRNNNHFFNLLIPKKYLSFDTEYRLVIYLVTEEINGCTYIQPYFKFQVHPTDKQIPNENPIFIILNSTNLKDYSDTMKQLTLELVVVMSTNPELMESEQPLPLFSTSNTDLVNLTKYDKQAAFKDAYHLHNLRFAVLLQKKQPGEEVFHRCDDIQYISQISTEDQKHRIRGN